MDVPFLVSKGHAYSRPDSLFDPDPDTDTEPDYYCSHDANQPTTRRDCNATRRELCFANPDFITDLLLHVHVIDPCPSSRGCPDQRTILTDVPARSRVCRF
jgi:hypothetical protein